jgi:putative DNA primase/helicase
MHDAAQHPHKQHNEPRAPRQAPGWTWGDLAVAQSAGGPASHLEEVPTDRPVPAYWQRDPLASLAAGWALYFVQPGPTAPRPSWRAAEVLARLLGGQTARVDASTGRPAWTVHCPVCRSHGAWLTPKRVQCRRCRRTMLLCDLSRHLTRGMVAWQDDDEGPGLPPPPLATEEKAEGAAAPEKTPAETQTSQETSAEPEKTPAEPETGSEGPAPSDPPEASGEAETPSLAFEGTDLRHARLLAQELRDQACWVPQWGWLLWVGTQWERDLEEGRVLTLAVDALSRYYLSRALEAQTKEERKHMIACAQHAQSRHVAANALALARAFLFARTEDFDADPWCLAVANGLLDLRSRELRPHDPSHRNTKVAPVTYDPAASCPLWQAHLEKVLPNTNVRRHVQRSLGIALVGACLEERLDIWHGEGANGKSTTARVLMTILGPYADRAAPKLLVHTKHPEHPTIFADLAGKRVIFSVEIDRGQKLAEEIVKMLTGGDKQKGRFMRHDYFSFEQTFSIFLLCNHRPIVRGTDMAIWRRIRLVPWTVIIPKDQRRPQAEVVAELAAEGPGILNWLLEGLHDWLQDPHWEAPEVQAATEAYRADMDQVGRFLAECCVRTPTARVETRALFEAYEKWCEQTGENPLSRKTVGEQLRRLGIETRHSQSRYFYVGVGLLAEGREGEELSASPPPSTHDRRENGKISPHPSPDAGEEVPF